MVDVKVTREGSAVTLKLVGSPRGSRMVFAHAFAARLHEQECHAAFSLSIVEGFNASVFEDPYTLVRVNSSSEKEARRMQSVINELLPRVS